MPRDKKQIESSLLVKGFEQKEGDHHFFSYRSYAGKKTAVFTKTSHTPKMKSISDELLSQMARQCKLTKQQFLELVDCPMNRDRYELILAAKELL